MSDQKSVEVPRLGSPGPNPGACAGTIQVDRTTGAPLVTPAVRREMLLMRAPAEFGRLGAFADEAVDRPRIDEFVGGLRHSRDLSIALGDVNDLDAEVAAQFGPGLAAAGDCRIHSGIFG